MRIQTTLKSQRKESHFIFTQFKLCSYDFLLCTASHVFGLLPLQELDRNIKDAFKNSFIILTYLSHTFNTMFTPIFNFYTCSNQLGRGATCGFMKLCLCPFCFSFICLYLNEMSLLIKPLYCSHAPNGASPDWVNESQADFENLRSR